MRSLMLTPWFAASAGVVIAAAVAVGSPAALTYSPSGPGVHCSVSRCAGPAPDRPDVATASPGVALHVRGGQSRGAAASAGPPRAGKAGGTGYEVGYQVITHRRHRFVAIITMPGNLAQGSWSLAFVFPSARVDQVWGAQWQASGNGDGGTASGPVQWTGQPAGAAGGRQFMVLASGTPATPSGCRLNGIRCSFG